MGMNEARQGYSAALDLIEEGKEPPGIEGHQPGSAAWSCGPVLWYYSCMDAIRFHLRRIS